LNESGLEVGRVVEKESGRRTGMSPYKNQNSPLPTYFQGRRVVDDYLDDFRDLILDSCYSDPKTIVVKFRRGLNPAIADAVATMAAGRPDDLDTEVWYEAAIRIDQNQAANAAFRSAHHVASQPKPLTAATATRFQPLLETQFQWILTQREEPANCRQLVSDVEK
jgi:hypothetical protein